MLDINVVILVDGQPRMLNLRDMLGVLARRRREMVTRRIVYELRKAREHGHVLEGQVAALSNINPVIGLTKNPLTPAEVKERLIATVQKPSVVEAAVKRVGADAYRPEDLDPQYGLRGGKYYLSPGQAQAILELRLHCLTGPEHEKLLSEYQEIFSLIGELIRTLINPACLMEVIREELEAIKAEFSDARCIEVVASQIGLTITDLITEEDRAATIPHGGHTKPQPLAACQAQRRDGKGESATGMKDEDYIERPLVVDSHVTLLLPSSKGEIYRLRTFEIPEISYTARGWPLVNLLPLDEGERTTAMLQTDLEALRQNGSADDDLDEVEGAVLEGEVIKAAEVEEVEGEAVKLVAEPTGACVFMATALDTVKKTSLVQFNHPCSNGLIALKLEEGDILIAAAIADGAKEVMLFSSTGKAIRSTESVTHVISRNARGVCGMRLGEGRQLISMLIPEPGTQILATSERGFSKRIPLSKFPYHDHGGQEMIVMATNEHNGASIATVQVQKGEKIMLISDQGIPIRTRIDEVPLPGRNTQGVTLIKFTNDEVLVGLERVQGPSGGDGKDLPEGEEVAESLDEPAGSESEPMTEVEGSEK